MPMCRVNRVFETSFRQCIAEVSLGVCLELRTVRFHFGDGHDQMMHRGFQVMLDRVQDVQFRSKLSGQLMGQLQRLSGSF